MWAASGLGGRGVLRRLCRALSCNQTLWSCIPHCEQQTTKVGQIAPAFERLHSVAVPSPCTSAASLLGSVQQ